MATPIFAINNGVFDSDIWSQTPAGAALAGLRPGPISIVMANSHTIYLPGDVSAAEWRNDAAHGATQGGDFVADVSLTVGGDIFAGPQMCLYCNSNLTLLNSATGGSENSAFGAYCEGDMTVAAAIGGVGDNAYGAASEAGMTVESAIGGSGHKAYGAYSLRRVTIGAGPFQYSDTGVAPFFGDFSLGDSPPASFPIIDTAGSIHQFIRLPPQGQNKTTLLIRCIDQYGNPETDVRVNVKLDGGVSGDGIAYDSAINSVTSGIDGMAITTIPRRAGLKFKLLRGDPDAGGRWVYFYGVDAETLTLPSIIAADE